MDYMTVRQAAEKWNLSPRSVQQLCTQGRIPGAGKFGKAWAIPADAEKPEDQRRKKQADQAGAGMPFTMMPLMNTPFLPGQCRETVESMEDGPQKDMAWAEYYYFSAQAEQAAQAAEPYLTSPDLGLRLSACWIYGYANLTTGQIRKARRALETVQRTLADGKNLSPDLRARCPLWPPGRQCCSICPCRRACPPPGSSCLCCPMACGPLPCMSRPTPSICGRTTPKAWAWRRQPWPWVRRRIPSLPSTSIW